MSAVLAAKDLPTVIGAAFEGGFYFDRIMVDGRPHAIIVAPKSEGEFEHDQPWNKSLKRVDGALSYNDSYANTVAMSEADSAIAKWARGVRIGGFDDWCIPARDVLERLHFLGKPTSDQNACWYRDGENPSAIPPAYPYTKKSPAQTQIEAFRAGGPEAFEPAWYWSSTQYEGDDDYAWAQGFGDGAQNDCHKSDDCRVRLVRLIQL